MTLPRSLSTAGVTFVNAQLGGEIGTLRIVGSRIAALGENPRAGDLIVDLKGDRMLPGLINAHDHLQLNSLPSLECSQQYQHVREWIADINARRRSDPLFEASVAIARDERLLIGGVKNLLSGVTTVAHHDPLYALLSTTEYPTGVVAEFGWSHSLYIDGEDQVRSSYEHTPPQWPWIIHAAEGLDESAAKEFDRLEELGCVGPNTLIVHGVALDHERRARLERAKAGLIWCPSSNLRLFGKTADVADLLERGRVALGTDSRLSGARDLLGELRLIGEVGRLEDHALESLVTRDNARLLRLSDRGSLQVGSRADILILPSGARLSRASRVDVRLVLLNGIVRYGDKDYAQIMAPSAHWVEVRVDGKPKILERGIAALLQNSRANENGLELPNVAWRAA
jgi:cytosine/adenosine deaminase-related metal-dependent hydrolase